MVGLLVSLVLCTTAPDATAPDTTAPDTIAPDTIAPEPTTPDPAATAPTSSRAPASTVTPAPAPKPPTPAAVKPERGPQPRPEQAESDAPITLDSERERGEDAKSSDEKFQHKGTAFDLRLGSIGCTREVCKNHKGKPGIRVDGFFGRNIAGIVDVGVGGGWGNMRSSVPSGSDGLLLFGIDSSAIPQEARDMLNLDALVVERARLDTVQAGLNVRIHFVRQGVVDPYIGAGMGYSLFRGRYDTAEGRTRIAFHGLGFPLQAGFVAWVHKNIAIGAQFDYIVTWYGGLTIRGAAGNFAAPLGRVRDEAKKADVSPPGDLPHYWTAGGVLHFRFGS